MKSSSIITLGVSLFLFASTSQATDYSYSTSTKTCHVYSIPVTASNLALKAGYKRFTSNFDVIDFVNNLSGRTRDPSLPVVIGPENRTALYNIGATICSPRKRSSKQKTILLATHGIGYDRRYWDSGISPEKYSFVDYATSQGYSVFFYDRLGTGKSSKVSGYDEAQAPTQLAILRQLTTLLRSGKYTGELNSPPSKIVHVGHSYGSFLSNALVATTPQLSDSAILTGVSYAGLAQQLLGKFGLRIANLQAPGKWPGRDNEYVTWVDVVANAGVFYHAGTYDKDVLWYTEDAKQPIAIGEFISVGIEAIFPQRALEFTKPVLVLTGETDFAFCAGNCTDILADGGNVQSTYFPKAVDFRAVIHPKVGHAINFSYNATGAYKVITDYLKTHDL